MFIRHKKLVLSGLATVWLGVAQMQAFTFVEDFSTDPVTGGRFNVPTGDSNRFVYSGGTLSAQYDTTLPTAKYLHPLGQSFTQSDPFTMIFDMKINSAVFYADANEFAPISVGAANQATTGVDRAGGVNGDAYDTVTADYFPNISTIFDSETLSPTIITTSNNPNYYSHVNFTYYGETAIQSEFPSGLPLDQIMRLVINYNPVGKALTITVSTNGTPLAINTIGSVGGLFDSDPTTIQTFLGGSAAFNIDSVGLLLWRDTFAGQYGSGTSVVANVEFSRIEFSSPIPEMDSSLGIVLGGLGMFLIWRTGASVMKRKLRNAFTLLELLIVVLIIALIASMLLPAINQAKQQAKLAKCTTNLRQLGLAVRMYLDDSGGRFFKYQESVSGGCYWYFGYETSASLSAPEGQRQIDVTKAKLYPYFATIGGVELCPSFPYELSTYKAKYKGASYGYGMNLRMDSAQESNWANKGGRLIWFADCAQINTWLAPASPANPMLEEWYYVDYTWKSVHFRHNGHANALFCDGHVESLPMYPGTIETKLPSANVGRFNATGDNSMFQ